MHILLNPGPVNVSPRVRAALAVPDCCHRETEYFDVQDAIRAQLPAVFGAPASEYTAVLLTGSGTAMVEAMIASAVPQGGRLLVVRNGVYGQRIGQMAAAHGIACDAIAAPLVERPDPGSVDRALARARYDALAIVHHETTTGLLNDLAPIAAVARARRVRLLVDAVSSLGGDRFDFPSWAPDAVACTANKCVQGLPGMSFALVRREFMEAMRALPERTVYLHLPRHHLEQERSSTPFTPAVQIACALRAAVEELAEETVPGRIARYARAAAIVRDGLEAVGLSILIAPALRSNTLTTFKLPLGLSYATLHDVLKREGFVIYAGQGAFADVCFRVANMGHVDEGEFRRFVNAVGACVG